MLQCSSCGRKQHSGRFCGACGSPLEPIVQEEDVTEEMDKESDEEKQIASKDADSKEAGVLEETSQVDVEAVSELEIEDEATAQTIENAPKEKTHPYDKQTATEAHEQVTIAHQEGSATAQQSQAAINQVENTDVHGAVKQYLQYSVALLKSPGQAFTHGEEKFTYGMINLILYALTFALIIISVTRGLYNKTIGGIESYLEFDSTGIFVQITFYLFIGMAIALVLVLLSLLAVEKVMIKRMTFKEIIVQYSGLLVPFTFLQVATLLFSFVGSSFITFTLVYISLFYSFFFLTCIYMYEKVTFYKSTHHRVYIAIGTTIFVVIVYMIVTVVFGVSFIENVTDMIDDMMYL